MIPALLFLAFINTVAYFILIFILQYLCFGHLKLTNRRLLICSVAAFSSLSVSQLFFSPRFSGFYLPFILFYISILIFSTRRMIDLLLSVLTILLYVALKTIPSSMFQTLFPIFTTKIHFFEAELDIMYLISDFILVTALLVIRHFINHYPYTYRTSYKEILFSILFPCYAFLMLVLVTFLGDATISKHVLFWLAFPPIAYILGLIYYFYVIFHGYYRIYQENQARTQQAYLKTQLDALQHLKDKEDNIHKMRHDLKNHLNLIESLCTQGNYEAVLSYSGKLNGMYSENIPALTGNQIADTIVHTKKKAAQDAGIDFSFEGSLSSLSVLSEPDICGLLANAYDNAIEACLPQEHAYIHTFANSTPNHTYIEIRNSITRKIRIRHNQLKTTKADKQNHGYGIEIMKQTAHKYHGNCNISSTDTEFLVEITLLTQQD